MRGLLIVCCLLLAVSASAAITYNGSHAGFMLGTPYTTQKNYTTPTITITYGMLSAVNISIKGTTTKPTYAIPSYAKKLFNGSCSTCDGMCVPKVKAVPKLGYSCLSTKGLPSSGFPGYTITAHYIVNNSW